MILGALRQSDPDASREWGAETARLATKRPSAYIQAGRAR